MRRRAFAIAAVLSLTLALVAAGAWVLSYYRPWSAIVYRGGDAQIPTTPTPESYSSAIVVENRAGRLVLLHQWVTLHRLPGDLPLTYAEVGRPREARIDAQNPFALGPGQSMVDGSGWSRGVPDPLKYRPSDTIGILLHPAGFSLGRYEPGPVRLLYSYDDGWHLLEPALVAGDPAPGRRGFTEYSGHDYMGYWQLMLPHWLFVLLGLPLPLLWLWTNRSSRRWAKEGRCTRCGYDLRESPERCPECGNPTPISV